MKIVNVTSFLAILICTLSFAQTPEELSVIAYYAGGPDKAEKLPAEKLTHIIFSFCHLKGNLLVVDNPRDSLTIRKLVALKKRNPHLKIILSLGGWGGCSTCSAVFSTSQGRADFAQSALALNKLFNSDGLDLDWEYPTIEGYPEHLYQPSDKENFTFLLKELRSRFGDEYQLSFAAGGFQKFLEQSVDWDQVMPYVDRVNIMTYDLVNGYAKETGHHTALYSNAKQRESTHNAVQFLKGIGVPSSKLVIGAAFYARVWENVSPANNGLYQKGDFKMAINYSDFRSGLKDFKRYWDATSHAPYAFDSKKKLFATFDDKQSLKEKTNYAIAEKLDGIMFWEIGLDTDTYGLVDCIYKAKMQSK